MSRTHPHHDPDPGRDGPPEAGQESRAGVDARHSELETALLAVARGLRRGWAAAIAHTGLAPHQARALRVIAKAGPIRPGLLAERLRITPRSVTEVVDVLVERDLISRLPDPTDRRAMTLELTEEGRALVAEITALRSAHTATVFDAELSAREQASLAYLLGRLADRLTP